jgi:hypothetical protein
MTQIARIAATLASLLLITLIQAPGASSQDPAGGQPLVAMASELPAFAPGQPAPPPFVSALVMRFDGASGRSDVIVLKDNASPADLHRAVAALNMVRARAKSLPAGRGGTIVVPGSKQDPSMSPETQRRAGNALARLRAQPVRQLEGVGQARWMNLADLQLDP